MHVEVGVCMCALFCLLRRPSPQALTEARYLSVVALYAAQLPTEAQVNSYARLLAGTCRVWDRGGGGGGQVCV